MPLAADCHNHGFGGAGYSGVSGTADAEATAFYTSADASLGGTGATYQGTSYSGFSEIGIPGIGSSYIVADVSGGGGPGSDDPYGGGYGGPESFYADFGPRSPTTATGAVAGALSGDIGIFLPTFLDTTVTENYTDVGILGDFWLGDGSSLEVASGEGLVTVVVTHQPVVEVFDPAGDGTRTQSLSWDYTFTWTGASASYSESGTTSYSLSEIWLGGDYSQELVIEGSVTYAGSSLTEWDANGYTGSYLVDRSGTNAYRHQHDWSVVTTTDPMMMDEVTTVTHRHQAEETETYAIHSVYAETYYAEQILNDPMSSETFEQVSEWGITTTVDTTGTISVDYDGTTITETGMFGDSSLTFNGTLHTESSGTTAYSTAWYRTETVDISSSQGTHAYSFAATGNDSGSTSFESVTDSELDIADGTELLTIDSTYDETGNSTAATTKDTSLNVETDTTTVSESFSGQSSVTTNSTLAETLQSTDLLDNGVLTTTLSTSRTSSGDLAFSSSSEGDSDRKREIGSVSGFNSLFDILDILTIFTGLFGSGTGNHYRTHVASSWTQAQSGTTSFNTTRTFDKAADGSTQMDYDTTRDTDLNVTSARESSFEHYETTPSRVVIDVGGSDGSVTTVATTSRSLQVHSERNGGGPAADGLAGKHRDDGDAGYDFRPVACGGCHGKDSLL